MVRHKTRLRQLYILVTAGMPIAGQSEPEPAVTSEVSSSQAHLQACPSPCHPSHRGVSEQHKYCALEESWRGSREGGRQTGQRAAPSREASLAFPAGCLGVLSPSTAAAGFGPSTLPASMSWQASPSSSFHFSSLVSIVLLFGELESMIKLEMWLASVSDATGCVFSFQIGLSLSTSSPGQLEGCTALL